MFARSLIRWFVFVVVGGWSAVASAEDQPQLVLDAGGHTNTVWKLAFANNGRELVTVSDDKSLRVWDLATGESLRVLRPPIAAGDVGQLRAVAVSPVGDLLAMAGYTLDDAIYLVSLATGRLKQTLRGHENVTLAVAFSPDGALLGSANADHTARLWNVKTGECVHVLAGHAHRVRDLCFAPQGRYAATASYDGTVRVWETTTGQLAVKLAGHAGEVNGVSWSPDGKLLAACGLVGEEAHDHAIRLFHADQDFRPGKRFGGLRSVVTSLAFLPGSEEVLFTRGPGASNECAILNLKTGAERVVFKSHNNSVYQGALSPDGTLAATTGGHDSETYVWNTRDGKVVRRLAAKSRSVWIAKWSPDGDTIAWGNDPRQQLERSFSLTALEFDARPDDRFHGAKIQRAGVPVNLQQSGDQVLTVSLGKEPRFSIDLQEYEVPKCFSLITDDLLVLGTSNGLALFDFRTGKRLRSFRGAHHVWSVAPSPDGRYILSASYDQILRIWKPGEVDWLLSLFVAGDDWIAWTPLGYYACSPGGESLMGWQVNRGSDELAAFHPATQFRDSLYRPDIVGRLLETGSLEQARSAADAARGKASQPAQIADVLPPLVVITSPDRSSVRLEEPTLEVRFVVRPVGRHPIAAVRLLIDGRPYPLAAKTFTPPRTGEVREAWSVMLEPGRHTLAVVAESAVSKGTSESIEVSYGARAVVRDDNRRNESERQALLPSLYVLAVGISDYPDSLKLNYAAKDAQAFADTCERHSARLYKKVEVKLITDQNATRRNVLGGLTWLRKQMTQNDVGIVFFAGHGGKDADGSLFLFPVDVDPEDLLSTGVPGDQLKKTLAGIPGRFVLLLDACHSGGIDGDKRRAGGALTDDLVRDLGTDEVGVIVMCSSTGREFSLESPAVEHGFFTLALVEGLAGKAQKSAEGAVYLHHLDAYVTDRVKDLSNGKQHPVTNRANLRSFPISQP